MNEIVKLENISKIFHQGGAKIYVLRRINLTISKGDIISITGYSGSGKSTLLQIASLLDSNYEGSVIYSGQNVRNFNENQKADFRLSKIGFVYQYHHLLRDFTVLENVIMPALIKGADLARSEQRGLDLLKELGVEDKAHFYPGQISGGQQQRVAIARAMINSPDVIFADEPTGNLDYSSAGRVFELFINLAKINNMAVVMVTHNETLSAKCPISLDLKEGSLSARLSY
ncbi:MAG: ABC transporter ATP-binding protein [Alphaproteobacteria bacterium]|nr:ABC transporter ATP-binding protein [Alphaproteobacteria bacterium]